MLDRLAVRRTGRRIWGAAAVAFALVILVLVTVSTASARAAAHEQAQLDAIVKHDGPSARSSPIVATAHGDVALIARALHVTDTNGFVAGSHTVTDIYGYSAAAWHRRGHVDFGADSLAPNIFFPPRQVSLTGATDFMVTLETAGASAVEIVSDAGGNWRAVPFDAPGQAPINSEVDVTLKGREITTGLNDCTPDCAQGHVTYTTWSYSAAAGAFVPVNAPSGPCKGSLSAGPFHLTATCFRRAGAQWSAQGSVSLDGVGISTGANTTITVSPLSESITATGPVSITVGSIEVYHGSLDLSLKGDISFSAKGKVKIKGLAVSGNIGLTPTPDGMQVTAFAGIDGFTGNLTLLVANDGTLDLKKLRLGLGNLPIKQLVLRSASLTYQQVAEGDEWTGDVKLALPGSLPVVDGTITILNGTINEIAANVTQINKPIGEVVFLQSLGIDVVLHPHLSATGSIGLSGGPKLPVINQPAVGLSASLNADFGSPVVLTAKGTITVGGSVQLAHAEAVWTVPSKLAIDGEASFSLGGASVDFKGSGLVDGRGFYVYGNGSLSLPGHSDVQAFGYLSEKGVTSCGVFTAGPLNVLLGFGYQWGDGFPNLWFDSCGALSFKSASAQGSARAAAVDGAVSIDVPAGQSQTLIGALGTGGYPAFSLRSPTGAVIASGGPGEGAIDHGGYLWVNDPNRQGTYAVLARPTPGTWTLTPSAGSAPVATVGSARSTPIPKVTTSVRRVRGRERLIWRSRAIPGQQLRFLEVGGRVATAIVATSRDRGSVPFTPTATGVGERRHIEIAVSVGGIPRTVLAGARFTVGARRLGRPRITVRRRGRRVRVSWTAVRGASGYRVVVTVGDGRRLFFGESGRRRQITLGGVTGARRIAVSVTATASGGVSGRTARSTSAGRRR